MAGRDDDRTGPGRRARTVHEQRRSRQHSDDPIEYDLDPGGDGGLDEVVSELRSDDHAARAWVVVDGVEFVQPPAAAFGIYQADAPAVGGSGQGCVQPRRSAADHDHVDIDPDIDIDLDLDLDLRIIGRRALATHHPPPDIGGGWE